MSVTNVILGARVKNDAVKNGAAKPQKPGPTSAASFWAQLQERLGLRQTFLMAGTLFLIPIATLFYFLVSSLQGQVDFSARERLGIPYIEPLVKLSSLLPMHGHYLVALATGSGSQSQVDASTKAVEGLMNEVGALNAQNGSALGTHETWASLFGKWQRLKANADAITSNQLASETEALRTLTLDFLVDVADKSNLTLDPDVDTYYLQNILVNGLPAISDELADLIARSAPYVGGRNLPPDLKAALDNNHVVHSVKKLRDAVERAFVFNPAVQNALKPSLDAVDKRVDATLGALLNGTAHAQGTSLSQGETYALAQAAGTDFATLAESTAQELARLIDVRIDSLHGRMIANGGVSVILALLAFATLWVLANGSIKTARAREEQAARIAEENQRNQQAILRLLDDMGNLADGDLTIQAHVSADFTGAIADSVNYAVGELRNLVQRVNQVTAEVETKTLEANQISMGLLHAAQQQSDEIQSASRSVDQVAGSAVKVSETATESANVAKRSLAAADEGARAVESSIKGMHDIRDQIQETAKRIKRLGESSQEIGEIIDLITDITEQTNVLALNAAIQAAAAGEAGRSFAVVAEEVQRLAERSGQATQQIGTLIRTIQRDTQEAVAAMERSTHGVVEGTRLSDATVTALTEIRSVSKTLAELIEQILREASDQATAATDMAKRMDNILMVTQQTSNDTQTANHAVSSLNESATALKASVAGFKM